MWSSVLVAHPANGFYVLCVLSCYSFHHSFLNHRVVYLRYCILSDSLNKFGHSPLTSHHSLSLETLNTVVHTIFKEL